MAQYGPKKLQSVNIKIKQIYSQREWMQLLYDEMPTAQSIQSAAWFLASVPNSWCTDQDWKIVPILHSSQCQTWHSPSFFHTSLLSIRWHTHTEHLFLGLLCICHGLHSLLQCSYKLCLGGNIPYVSLKNREALPGLSTTEKEKRKYFFVMEKKKLFKWFLLKK